MLLKNLIKNISKDKGKILLSQDFHLIAKKLKKIIFFLLSKEINLMVKNL